MMQNDADGEHPVLHGSKMAMLVDDRGLTVYSNKNGLLSLAARLSRIAEARADDCFACHVRMELGDPYNHGRSGKVSLSVDEEIATFFLRLPADAFPFDFELTFMHVAEDVLGDLAPDIRAAK
jgi:hypothetical protein